MSGGNPLAIARSWSWAIRRSPLHRPSQPEPVRVNSMDSSGPEMEMWLASGGASQMAKYST